MIALFAGSFDPPTFGHIDIIERASKVVAHLIVGVAINSKKQSLLSMDTRVKLLRSLTGHLSNVEVATYSKLTTDFAKENKVNVLVRGLRTTSDYHSEFQLALANRQLSGLETLFLLGDERHSHISSTLIREIAHAGGSLSAFVSEDVARAVSRPGQKLTN